jgi:hypothetical protein
LTHIKYARTAPRDGAVMNQIRDSLSAHHDVMDALVAEALAAARAARWPEYRLRFAELRRALIEHMTYEDEALFPALAREIGDAQVAPLRMQHERLQQHFETLASAAAEHDPEGCVAEMEALAALLRAHHEHEQRVCYPRSARADTTPPAFHAPAPPLDLRGLQPPEPIVRIFQALERAPREPLCVILPHEPVPLYGLLRERGFSYRGSPRPDGGFEVLIEPS